MDLPLSDLNQVKRVLETALLSSSEPLPIADLKKLFDDEIGADVVRRLLEDLRGRLARARCRTGRMSHRAGAFRFVRSTKDFSTGSIPQKPPKYSRAVLETLAIIAYRQPVTRGDIESIRGVTVSAGILKALEARGWIDEVGHREVPGRPALYCDDALVPGRPGVAVARRTAHRWRIWVRWSKVGAGGGSSRATR